jgi:hypothetical protein
MKVMSNSIDTENHEHPRNRTVARPSTKRRGIRKGRLMSTATMTISTARLFALVALALLFQAGAVRAQTSTFTYQGRFTDSGTAANGTYDMQFKLFDGAGNQVGSTITNSAVTVTSGVFTVQLDYGGAAFPGADRSLEIGVRLAGSGDAYTVLSPRQPLTSTPYAIRAGATTSADTAANATQLGGVAANQYVQTNDPRLTDARSPSAGSSNIQNTNTVQLAANFNIGGNGTANGTLQANFINAATQYRLGGIRILSAAGSFNLFAGADAGAANTGTANTFVGANAGLANTSGSLNAFFGTQAGKANINGNGNAFFGGAAGFNNNANSNSFFGNGAGLSTENGSNNTFMGRDAGSNNVDGNNNTAVGWQAGEFFTGSGNTLIGASTGIAAGGLVNATAIGYGAQVSQSNSLVLGNSSTPTNVGIGTNAPSERLTVKTATTKYGVIHTDGTITVGTFVGGSTGGGWFGTKSNHSLSFFVNDGSASMTIDTGGAVRINTLGVAGLTSLCRNILNQISTCSSSLRYKTNVQPFIGGLAVVKRLRPITFDWKQGGVHDLGFGAEDVATVEPLLVTRNDQGQVEGVKYDRITAVLVNAVKEQQEQIKLQQSEIASLKKLVCRNNRNAGVCK